MIDRIAALKPGSNIALKLRRNNGNITLQVNIGKRPPPRPERESE